MTEEDEPERDDDPLIELFGPDEEEDVGPPVAPSWLGALGQMGGAALVVLAVLVAFVAAAVVLRRLWP